MTASLHYLAGVLDTNGTIIMRTSKGYTWPVMRVDGPRELLEMFADRFGGAVGKVPSRRSPYWIKQGSECQRVLREMLPFMILRQDVVRKILEWKSKEPQKAAGPRNRVAKQRAAKGPPPVPLAGWINPYL